jgi:hypothetical protein
VTDSTAEKIAEKLVTAGLKGSSTIKEKNSSGERREYSAMLGGGLEVTCTTMKEENSLG